MKVKKLLNEEQALTSELKIVTKEHSPLLIQNKLPIKQEFNDKVSISIEGEDGDLFYAKEVEKTLIYGKLIGLISLISKSL